ncbi:helix-turn-helix domain-containing protein [Collimonas fungivorans]|uniref:helix-turn-helix domain-containing protein n=1 Tax=Collimonas fungivorans TaxID=158899 RepID=UPI003FA38686
MTNKLMFGERMREERNRLGFTQQEAANLLQVGREMWSRYERGVALPGAEALMAFADAGGDVQYVLTGQRSNISLTPDEKELLSGYRNLDIRGKANMLGMLDVVGTTPPEKPKRATSQETYGTKYAAAVKQVVEGNQTFHGDLNFQVNDKKKKKKPL